MPSLVIVYTFAALALAGASIPLILKLVPPNKSYGLRTPLTLSSPDLWYRANVHGGWRQLCFALMVFTAAVLFHFAGLDEELSYPLSMVTVVAIGLGILLYQNSCYLRQLQES